MTNGWVAAAPESRSCQRVRKQARPATAWAATTAREARWARRQMGSRTKRQPRQAPRGMITSPATLKTITAKCAARISAADAEPFTLAILDAMARGIQSIDVMDATAPVDRRAVRPSGPAHSPDQILESREQLGHGRSLVGVKGGR